MASTIIHLAVAKRIKDELDVENPKDYYLGAIAPNISKQIGETKEESHFLKNTSKDIPNINLFVKRYPTFKYSSFDLGYFIHLYTDKLWIENLCSKMILENNIKLLDGTTVEADEEEQTKMIYSDYTNLNIKIIEDYDLDLSLFYEDFIVPKTNIKEIPVERLDVLLNKMGIIIENSKEKKEYVLDHTKIVVFIEETANIILEELKKY